jgi:hypothetical protein
MPLAHFFPNATAASVQRLLLFVWLGMIIGCTTIPAPLVEKSQNLRQALTVFIAVSDYKNDYQNHTVRCDWLPWYYEGVERAYGCAVPYFPYVASNGILMYFKESIMLPTWVVTGGSRHQDEAEKLVRKHNYPYQQMYTACWPREHSHANVINMDAWNFKEGIHFQTDAKHE